MSNISRANSAGLSPTELRLDASRDLDSRSSVDILRLLNKHDAIAVAAVGAAIPAIAEVVDRAIGAFQAGNNVHYFGAGTSGRLGVLDAAELRPTFNLEAGRVIAHIAGGAKALVDAVEDAEDSEAAGAAEAADVRDGDIVIGLAASGNTPYVGGALRAARAAGAVTVLMSSNPNASLAPLADHNIVLDTGAEVLTGSTRLKAGTAEKLALNGFSTALMIGVGRVWSNLMVDVVATNAKLRERTVRILRDATGIDDETALATLAESGDDLKVAILMVAGSIDADRSRTLLQVSSGNVRRALEALHTP